VDTQYDKGHGRVEVRKLEVIKITDKMVNWVGAQQVCRVTRKRILRGKDTEEVSYFITSLAPIKDELANAKKLLILCRDHWSIENSLHWVRDETMNEDRSTARVGIIPQMLASLRNLSLTIVRSEGYNNIVEGREKFVWNVGLAIKTIINAKR